MPREVDTHSREQARANARVAVENAEEDPMIAAQLAVAYALLDIADALREGFRKVGQGGETR